MEVLKAQINRSCRWVDKDREKFNFEEADEEDERRDDEMEEYEEKYNFRFEQPGADQVISEG